MVDLDPLDEGDLETLREMLTDARDRRPARRSPPQLLEQLERFTKVMPRDYKRVLAEMAADSADLASTTTAGS